MYQNSADVIEKLKNKDIKRVAVVVLVILVLSLEAFQRKGKEVVLIDVVDTCLAGYYDRDLSDLMAKTWKTMVSVAFGQTVKEVAGDGKVEKIITDKNEYDVDMVILAVGFPNTAFAGEGIERFRNGAFLVKQTPRNFNPRRLRYW